MSDVRQRGCAGCERELTSAELREAQKWMSPRRELEPLCATCLYRRRLNNRRRAGVVLLLFLALTGWFVHDADTKGDLDPECTPESYAVQPC